MRNIFNQLRFSHGESFPIQSDALEVDFGVGVDNTKPITQISKNSSDEHSRRIVFNSTEETAVNDFGVIFRNFDPVEPVKTKAIPVAIAPSSSGVAKTVGYTRGSYPQNSPLALSEDSSLFSFSGAGLSTQNESLIERVYVGQL